MSNGVLATVTWTIKPELIATCIESLRGMFPETRLKKGFRSIRLLRSASVLNDFILMQEWDDVADHQSYMQFRSDTGDMAKLLAMTTCPPKVEYWSLDPLAAAQA